MTDVLGICVSWAEGRCVVRREEGDLVEMATADIVSGKPVPPRPSVHRHLGAEQADRLALPVLLVAGREDPMGSPASQQALAERIGAVSPRVSLAMLPGVGHLLHYEKAPECAALVEGFLAG